MTSAFLNVRSAVAPSTVSSPGAIDRGTTDFERLFALDRLRAERHRLVCRWRQDADGRLSCIWEPDIVRNWRD
jgi:hypothetical protein